MIKNKKIFFSTKTLLVFGLMIPLTTVFAEDDAKPPEQPEQPQHQHQHEHQHGMRMDMEGMVMNENTDKLPKDCTEISEEITLKVKTGIEYAKQFAGTVFGFDKHQWSVKPCARVTVEFENEDEVRHQWMIHGLPKYLYPKGMFHIEVNGLAKKTGTFIVPSSHFTYLVHCDVSQHMEKGMKAQLVVGKGRKDLPSIPGISAPTYPDKF